MATFNALHAAITPDSVALVDTTPYGATFANPDVNRPAGSEPSCPSWLVVFAA